MLCCAVLCCAVLCCAVPGIKELFAHLSAKTVHIENSGSGVLIQGENFNQQVVIRERSEIRSCERSSEGIRRRDPNKGVFSDYGFLV